MTIETQSQSEPMGRLLAFIDGSVYGDSVVDHTLWAAGRLAPATIELLRVLGRREASSEDRSGRIIAGARRQLLEELARLDAERAKLVMRESRLEMEEIAARIAQRAPDLGETRLTLRHGDLLESFAELEPTVDMAIIGKRGEAADFAKLHLGSNLERIVRASSKPLLIASRAFQPINCALIAFDGRPSALKAVDAASRSPLFQGLRIRLISAGDPTSAVKSQLDAAAEQLRGGGLDVSAEALSGAPNIVIPEVVAKEGVDLLVMGAYNHSRLRTLVIGSTTSEMIRNCKIPILVYR